MNETSYKISLSLLAATSDARVNAIYGYGHVASVYGTGRGSLDRLDSWRRPVSFKFLDGNEI